MEKSAAEARREEATKLYSKCFTRLTFGFNEIEQFQQGYEYGRPLAHMQIRQAGADFARLVYDLPEFDKYFKDRAAFLKAAGGIDGLAQSTSDKQIAGYAAAVDSAMLFFAHAVLDQVARDLLVVTALARPDRWEQHIEKKQVTFEEMRGRSYDELVAEKALAYAKSYDYKSLMDKVDQLFRVCRPTNMDLMSGYEFDRARLEKLDERRHDVAHRAAMSPLPNGRLDIDFLKKTGYFTFGIVNDTLDVKMDAQYAFTD